MERKRTRHLTPLAKQARAQGLNQIDVAAVMRVKPSTVSCWFTGKFRPEAARMPKLAQCLGVPPIEAEELVDRSMEMEVA